MTLENSVLCCDNTVSGYLQYVSCLKSGPGDDCLLYFLLHVVSLPVSLYISSPCPPAHLILVLVFFCPFFLLFFCLLLSPFLYLHLKYYLTFFLLLSFFVSLMAPHPCCFPFSLSLSIAFHLSSPLVLGTVWLCLEKRRVCGS